MTKDVDLGIEAARAAGAQAHADTLETLKGQLLIVFLKRLKRRYGDKLIFPVEEVDDTGSDIVAFGIDEQKRFIFELRKKQ